MIAWPERQTGRGLGRERVGRAELSTVHVPNAKARTGRNKIENRLIKNLQASIIQKTAAVSPLESID